jgi:membrane protein DedA with SNARE-associated domain/membrane-associated phospholipid phosphatase
VGNITHYIDQFGYIVLFFALLLEMIAIPLPGEVLMSYSGYLVYMGHFNWLLSIVLASAGACMGMSISYWIGFKLGKPFFEKYGHRVHLGPERIEKTSQWFSKHGNKLLIFAYFVPGVRHITGYFSGLTRLPFKTFALFAYTGAFLWVSVFISLGKILGPQWEQFHSSVKKYLIIGSIVAAVILLVIYIYKKHKAEVKLVATNILDWTLRIFHSRKRVGLMMVLTAITTLGLILLMIGMIQDYLGNEFQDFNKLLGVLIPSVFNEGWKGAMLAFMFMGSRTVMITLIIITLLRIIWKGQDKLLELQSLVLVVYGGEVYEESLRKIFHKLAPVNHSLLNELVYAFPSEQSLMNMIVYGFIVYIFVRHSKNIWNPTIVPLLGILILLFISISRIYLQLELPSDVLAGYVFGGVWLGLNIILVETFRILRHLEA